MFPDPELDANIREQLGLSPEQPISTEQLAGLSELFVSYGVDSIAGLECATNLTWLAIWGDVDSLEAITGLPLLEYLHLNSNDLGAASHFAPVASLPALERLVVSGAAGLALGVFEGSHPPLTSLSLDAETVSDAHTLAGFTLLEDLRLRGADFDDIAFVGEMPALSYLRLFNTQVSDLSPLAGAVNLETLDIKWAPVLADLSPLADIGLVSLTCENTQVDDISVLATMPNLSFINLRESPVVDLGPLAGSPTLEQLWISDTQVSDLSPLASVPTLIELLANNLALGPLPEGISATQLSLSGCGLVDIAPLASWGPPERWGLEDNAIDDLSPLLVAPWMFDGIECHELSLWGNPLSGPGNVGVVDQMCAQGVSFTSEFDELSCVAGFCDLLPP